ncbi:MAG TPA: adenosylcobalamin-dependent ribonucleoside-diphosphate reductase [Steroidobacteraceae bacterium]|jgi:ribonucleoside-diphosphate reductase alpha chain
MAVPSLSTIAQFIWETRYRDAEARPAEQTIVDSWVRVARAAAAIETEPALWQQRFFDLLQDLRFLPGGRILAGAGSSRRLTLFNCFVMGTIGDSLEAIFEALKEGALTMQQGGGVGYDFSTLRPRGSRARATGTIASGPVSFMALWDVMCATMLSTSARRGAMMATLRCDHPDIEEFIDVKRAPRALRHFNLSVLISDAFMEAVKTDREWPLVFPDPASSEEAAPGSRWVQRCWSGAMGPVRCRVHKTLRARALWEQLCTSAFDCAEPGVLFIDYINAMNNLGYCERLSATNPCGEEPLPPYGACNLGSLNAGAFVRDAFARSARLDEDAMRAATRIAVRFLDDVIDIAGVALPAQREAVRRARRIGLGITGLADALAMLRLRYDSEAGRHAAATLMRAVRDAAYEASIELAREKGAFPAFDADQYLARPFVRSLPDAIQARIARDGIRNSHLTAIAPAGTISLLANNVSSGIEPIFGLEVERRVLDANGVPHTFNLVDPAFAAWRDLHSEARPPDFFLEGQAIAPREHLLMQAALQPYVDGAISKTIALPEDSRAQDVAVIYEAAYELDLKGCTVHRSVARPGVVERLPAHQPQTGT